MENIAVGKDILTVNHELMLMMSCPSCGTIMVWLNGSVLHDPPVKEYECRRCQIFVVKYPDGDYEERPITLEPTQNGNHNEDK